MTGVKCPACGESEEFAADVLCWRTIKFYSDGIIDEDKVVEQTPSEVTEAFYQADEFDICERRAYCYSCGHESIIVDFEKNGTISVIGLIDKTNKTLDEIKAEAATIRALHAVKLTCVNKNK